MTFASHALFRDWLDPIFYGRLLHARDSFFATQTFCDDSFRASLLESFYAPAQLLDLRLSVENFGEPGVFARSGTPAVGNEEPPCGVDASIVRLRRPPLAKIALRALSLSLGLVMQLFPGPGTRLARQMFGVGSTFAAPLVFAFSLVSSLEVAANLLRNATVTARRVSSGAHKARL